jgi:hypothetical protein
MRAVAAARAARDVHGGWDAHREQMREWLRRQDRVVDAADDVRRDERGEVA